MQTVRIDRGRVVAKLMSLLCVLLATAQLACATVRDWNPDDQHSASLYRRPHPPKARIPGVASTEHRYASAVAPMRLTASDGTGLALRSLQIEGLIEEPVSMIELHLTFENPHDQQLDAQFEILLPRGAEVSRFALKVNGQFIESEVVERAQAQQVYDAHKAARRDPAILQRERGRRFSGRIFPIAPRERKEIILSYSVVHERVGGTFRVPLAGLPRVDELDIHVQRQRPTGEVEQFEHHAEHEAPTKDFTIDLDGAPALGLASGNEALLRIVPVPNQDTSDQDKPAGLSVLIDTSASSAGSALAMEDALGGLLEALEAQGLTQLPIEVLAFDQQVERLFTGTVGEADERVVQALRGRARLGASDLAGALAARNHSFDRLLTFTDGEVTAGANNRFELAQAIEREHDRGLARIDAIVLAQSSDLELLDWLVGPERLHAGAVFDASRTSPQHWAQGMFAGSIGAIELDIPGAEQLWPRSVDGLRPGQAVMIHATFKRDAPRRAKVVITGARSSSQEVELRRSEGPLAKRAIAVMRVKALMAGLLVGASAETAQAMKRELVALSREHRILNDYTAMLALESDRDYARFGIERSKHADRGLSVGVDGVVVSMDEAKSLPVGNNGAFGEVGESRDFTAVVDISPTANRDVSGISLAGTTGAEQRYTIEGSSIDYARAVRVRRQKTRASVRAHNVGRVPSKLPPEAKQLQAQLDDKMLVCARHSAATDGHVWSDILLALRFDADGRLLEVKAARQTPIYDSLIECVRYQLRELAGPGFEARGKGATAAYELRRSYRVVAQQGDNPPEDWLLPEVSAWARNEQAAKQTGVTGWAQFIEEDLAAGLTEEALDVAWTWHQARPNDILPYVSLGRALTAVGKSNDAVRAYGSLIDIEPSRPETRRFAGALLESTGDPLALELAIDSYRKARALRPDHPTGYHALAMALAQRGDYHEAVEVLVDALSRTYAAGHFGDVTDLLRRDLETLAAVAILTDPNSRTTVLSQLVDTMVIPKAEARDRLTLTWESEASELQLNVHDLYGGLHTHSSASEGFSAPVNNGFGPQSFEWLEVVEGPLRVEVDAPQLGPSGFAMGRVQRLRFDGEGAIEFDTRPFVIWPGEYAVDLGEIADRWGGTEDWRG